ncbi:protein slit-like [Uloborus diversus]|uniref:protein slit-like n=1 Tax=Uloborus diversus TaxID=327109 RepID=UPI0024096B3D|nr:protein slit-like [Uloborus diversus]
MHRLALVVFVVLNALYISECLEHDCPPTFESKECTCVPAFGKVFLECSGLRSLKQLKDVFTTMKGYALTELKIRNSNFPYIPYDLFKDSSVTRIRISNSTLLYLFNRDLISVEETVTEILLENVDFDGGLDWSILENLSRLKTLSLLHTSLETIGYEVSQLELPVETLLMSDNEIVMLDDGAFQKFTSLTNLKLSNNEITEVKRSMFPQPTCGLQFLDLSFNQLTSFPEDMFDGMPQFHSLILRSNDFVSLDHIHVRSIFPALAFLDVSDNPLRCGCELSWLLEEDKPYHFFGQCKNIQDSKNLKDLAKEDFAECE